MPLYRALAIKRRTVGELALRHLGSSVWSHSAIAASAPAPFLCRAFDWCRTGEACATADDFLLRRLHLILWTKRLIPRNMASISVAFHCNGSCWLESGQ
jgi:hypothetical protein